MSHINVLRTNQMTIKFGGVVAVDSLSLEVNDGEIVALIGPNGAGKTTAFNIITGVYKPTSGMVMFAPGGGKDNVRDITGLSPDRITKMGMARTFQNIRLFKELSVLDNVLIAKHLHIKSGLLESAFMFPGALREERQMHAEALALLSRLGLADYKDDIASSLPYGLQRRLEIARALATEPRLLLLDEPAAGMNPQETKELTTFIRELKHEFHLSVLMIEHHMDLVMEISDRIYVLDFGKLIASGTADEVQNNPRVIEAYLGVAADADD
ncbi:MAG: ABC transporter ATP-binding protein [Angelakisella sp.]